MIYLAMAVTIRLAARLARWRSPVKLYVHGMNKGLDCSQAGI
jgi:hypothetical protein